MTRSERPAQKGFSRHGLPHLACLSVLLSFLFFSPIFSPALRTAAFGGDKGHNKSYALIFGTVWGPNDRPLYGVRVKIRRADQKKAKWEFYSDHNGEFAARVPAGTADYLVTADLNDYKSPDGKRLQAGEEVKVHIDDDERADCGLHLKY